MSHDPLTRMSVPAAVGGPMLLQPRTPAGPDGTADGEADAGNACAGIAVACALCAPFWVGLALLGALTLH